VSVIYLHHAGNQLRIDVEITNQIVASSGCAGPSGIRNTFASN